MPGLENNEKRMLPVDQDEPIFAVPETSESFGVVVGVKNGVNNACNNLKRKSSNNVFTRVICQILIGELDKQLQSILGQNRDFVTPMQRNEKHRSWRVKKRVDGTILKFPLRQRKQPDITLNEAIHLSNGICPQLMKTGDAVIAEICGKAKVLVQEWSTFYENLIRNMGQ